jgi:hypothetical protein
MIAAAPAVNTGRHQDGRRGREPDEPIGHRYNYARHDFPNGSSSPYTTTRRGVSRGDPRPVVARRRVMAEASRRHDLAVDLLRP